MEQKIVETNNGKIRGYVRGNAVCYRGIPFAQPPVGELRFKRAVPAKPWDGVLDAKEWGAPSVQLDDGKLLGSEDCLTLNVETPLAGEGLPIFVWIHGGGYNTGRASDPLFDSTAFTEAGIVFASLQYRLNVLGFYDFTTYPGCEDFDSNCGVSDQILGLRWIHENIEAFGGDPKRVTICGESAGGATMVNMLAIPSVKGYFQQVIAESALPNCVMTHEMARHNIDLFLEGMGWTEEDLPKLRTIDPYELQKGNLYVAERHQYANPGMFLPGPIQDDLMPVRPIDAIRQGSAAGVRLIIGTNRHEGTMFVHPEKTGFPNSWAMVAEMFEKNDHAAMLPEILAYYHPGTRDKFIEFQAQPEFTQNSLPNVKSTYRTKGGDPFIEFATDYAFFMPSIKVADAQRQYGDTWMYRFEFVSKSGEKTGWKASHAFELPAVFGVRNHPFSDFVFDGETQETFDRLVADIQTPWIQFIKTGNPGWPNYRGPLSPVMVFDRESRVETMDQGILLKVWGDARFYEK